MAYNSNLKPTDLTGLSTLETNDVVVVGDASDLSEFAKQISIADLITFLNASLSFGSGAVASVNGETGTVVLDSDDLSEGGTNLFLTSAERSAISTNTGKVGYTDGAVDARLTAKGIADGAQPDQTGAEIVTAIDTELGGSTWQSGGGSGSNTVSDLGNLGATETVDFSAADIFYGTLDSDVTISNSTETEGKQILLVLSYDGSAQRTITWSDVDEWSQGVAPTAPDSATLDLLVTLTFVNGTCYGSHTSAVAGGGGGGVSDHGALTGLTDDDHTQYVILDSIAGSGAPVGAPSRVGAEYIDLTNKRVYKAFGTSGVADWRYYETVAA